jgi:hypothetical protein
MKVVSILALATALGVVPAEAQPAGNIRSLTRYTLKTDKLGDMRAAIKEYNRVIKKAGSDRANTVWSSLTGPAELVLVSYHQKWAEFDAPANDDPKLKDVRCQLSAISARINQCFTAMDRLDDILDPNLSLPRSGQPPKMIQVWTGHVKPERVVEFLDNEKNTYLPAIKAAGVTTYIFARNRFGGSSYEFRSSVGISNWADLDGPNPLRKAMGDAKYQEFVDKMNGMLVDYRYDLYRFEPDLSLVPEKN